MMLLETTLHRIGGVDGPPRQFVPVAHQLSRTAYEYREIRSVVENYWVRLMFRDWADVDDDWVSCLIRMEDVAGQLIGERPALIYRRPYDVPTYALFRPPWPEAGTFSLGLRMLTAA